MFIEEHLQLLRRARFRPQAMVSYAHRLTRHVRENIDANPGAVRSVWSVALGFFAATFVAAGAMAIAYDRHLAYDFFLQTALWILPAFAFVTAGIGLLRDRQGYRLSALNLPIAVWVLESAFRRIPGQLDEAATLDGLSLFQRLTKLGVLKYA